MNPVPFLTPQSADVEEISKPSRQLRYANGGTWVPFYLGASLTPPDVELKTSDTTRLVVSLHCHGMWRTTINFSGTSYDYLEIPSAGHTTDIGQPNLPLITRLVQVPKNVDLTIETLYSNYTELDNYDVVPAQLIPSPEPNMTLPLFTINQTTYTTDVLYPTSLAWIVGGVASSPMIIRGHRVVSLSFVPVQYNPVTQSCRAYFEIEVALNYNQPARLEPIDSRLMSPVFEEMFQGLLLNYPRQGTKCPHSTFRARQPPTQGWEYLIITMDNPAIVAEVGRLAQWKTQKGVPTRLVTVSEITDSTNLAVIREEITQFVQDVYRDWDPAPTYVLLVGDDDTVPTRYDPEGYLDPFENPTTPNLASDLWYFTVDGDDYIPDILYGRISVDTPIEAQTVVDKILTYEQQGVTDPEFYSKMCASAYFQDGFVFPHPQWLENPPDGVEDPHFRLVDTAENIFCFFDGGRSSPRYSVDRIYCKSYPPFAPLFFEDGTALDESLDANVYDWLDDIRKTQAIIDAINEGRFLVFNLDHGESQNKNTIGVPLRGAFDGWQSPHFTTEDLIDLVNGAKLPVVLSMDCNCGWFDGETDLEIGTGGDMAFESFSEEITRMAGGGAVAAIGATRRSPSLGSDSLLYGMVDAIWDDSDTTLNSGWLKSLGSILWYGKMYVLNEWGYAGGEVPTPLGDLPLLTYGMTQGTFELYHLFGDPEMPLWTEEPLELDVSYPAQIGTSAIQSFGVKVTLKGTDDRVNSARVCLQKGDEIYEVEYTDSQGFVVFYITPGSGGSMSVTVTAPGYLPYEGEIIVMESDATLSLSMDEGLGGSVLRIEGTELGSSFTLSWYTYPVTYVIYYGTTGPTMVINWLVPEGPPEPLTIIIEGETPNQISVACFIRLLEKPDPYIYCHWDATTWHLNPEGAEQVWDNPCIRIVDTAGFLVEPSLTNPLTAQETYIFEADIHNAGPVQAENVDVTFWWAPFQAGEAIWHEFASETISIDAGSAVTVFEPYTFEENKLIVVRVTIECAQDSNLDNNEGWECWSEFPIPSDGNGPSPMRMLSEPIPLILYNPTNTTSTVFVEAIQLGDLDDIWTLRLDRNPLPKLPPDETEVIMIRFAFPSGIPFNTTHNFRINAYVGQCLIGGVEIRARKIPPPTIIDPLLPIAGGVAILLVVVIIIVLVKRWRS
jgi:hypothetical protein